MNKKDVAKICENLAYKPAATFHEALQSLWFLFVVLHMESNASSFSPGRLDETLYSYYKQDIASGMLKESEALELIECLWLKFNEMRIVLSILRVFQLDSIFVSVDKIKMAMILVMN